jgi:hypothetical protein
MIGGMFVQVLRVMMTMVNVVVRARMIMIMRIVGSACVLMIGGDRRRLAGLQIKQCCFATLASAIRAH